MTKTTLKDRLIRAEELSSHWLAEGNEASERGDTVRAERFYKKAQFWLDRYNSLAIKADRASLAKLAKARGEAM